jgi:hypothetical protein
MLVGKVTTKEGGGSLAGSVAALTEKNSSVGVALSEVIMTFMTGGVPRNCQHEPEVQAIQTTAQPRYVTLKQGISFA